MKRKLMARLFLTAVGTAVWFYGFATESSATRAAGIAILAISLIVRFIPARYIDPDDPNEARGRGPRRDDEHRS